ncbi:MAG: thermonuclease family protein [Acidimicrobiales bacterium]
MRATVAACAALVLTGAFADGATPAGPAGAATIVHPVDGDTVVVRVGGVEESVRLIGIDTPESVARDRPVECFGPEAKARLAELLPPGTEVRLERDVESRDRFGRLLAYVFRAADDLHVNLVLVQEGYAEARRFEPNVTRQAELDRAEDDAKAANRGLWPVCGGTNTPIGPPPG